MVMSKGNMVLALGMLITGSLNTITTNMANQRLADGTGAPSTIWGYLNGEDKEPHYFNHPFLQAEIMFMGEFLCMLAHLITREKTEETKIRTRSTAFWALPACCDMAATGTMYVGLCLTYASVFQMLRGASVVFTALISAIFLKRKMYMFHWTAVLLVVAGVGVVGVASMSSSADDTEGKTDTGVMIGNILIICAQLVVSIQMCVEEKIAGMYETPALKAVGSEGMFGMLILGFVLIPMNYINIEGYPVENVSDGLSQMKNNPVIIVAMMGNMCSIAAFNFFGISVTKAMSASHRMVLDSVRTIVVWACSLALGWEKFHVLQLLGFFLLGTGTGMYNEIIVFPAIFEYPKPVEGSEALSMAPSPEAANRDQQAD